MKQQQLEAQLEEIRALASTIMGGASAIEVANKILLTYEKDYSSPSGGKVDARVSNTLAARRPGSSPGTGTITPCTGCGAADPDKRCLGCLHDFTPSTPQATACQACGAPGAERYRQRTQYPDEESNWAALCGPCREENDAYWDERWAEYYAGCL